MLHNYLNGTQFVIDQNEEMYHFNSDTELLGRSMRIYKTDSVLDIGTNNGALLFYALEKGATDLTGIDLFDEVIALARHNFDKYGRNVNLHKSSVQDFVHAPFNVIVCNPPYFNTQNDELKTDNPFIKAARHEEYLTLSDLIFHVHRLLKDNGRFYLVHRPQRMTEVFQLVQSNEMQITKMQIVYGSLHTSAKTVLYEIRQGNGSEVQICEPVFMNDRDSFPNMK